jgi:aspartate dehydrogenase
MLTQPRRVGLIGCGAIGRSVVELAASYSTEMVVIAALTRSGRPNVPETSVPLVDTLDALLDQQPDIVVEVAGHAALRQHGPGVLRSGCDLIAVSVGILADPAVERELLAAARQDNSQLRIAAGAIGALDALAAAKIGGIERVTHTTRKPASTLLGDDALGMADAREIFNGSAREAVMRFPESVNVTAAVSLAGVGFDRTVVRVIADPAVDHNIHVVEASGVFGSFQFEIRNVPSDSNPRTGRIVAMSIVSALRQPCLSLSIG